MAYAEKYYHEFCNPFGQICRISILELDFIGASIELEGQPDPIVKTYDNSDEFKFKPIIPSTVEIRLAFGTGNGVDFSEFWESDEKTFKVEYFIGGVLDWAGFVITDGFQYNLTGGVYYANITATDGLSTLESILFKDENTNEPYGLTDLTYNNGFDFPFILIATEILRKLDLNFDLWTLIDVYEKNQIDRTSDSRDSDPLTKTYVNVKTYINESKRNDIPYFEDVNEVWNCKKVMENLLHVWGAKLYQDNGTWRIKRINVDTKYGFDYPKELGVNNFFYKAFYSNSPETALDPVNSVYDTNLDIYAFQDIDVLGIGDFTSNESTITTPAQAGFYKLFTTGKIIEVAVNGSISNIYSFTEPIYYWHKYNTLAGYVGREEINDVITIPCDDNNQFLLGNDHVLRMDDVYKQFRVNYEYSYLKDDDSPINLIKNGNFEALYTQYGGIEAPPNWYRIRWGGEYLRLSTDDIPILERNQANNNTKMLVMGRQYNDLNKANKRSSARITAALGQNNIPIDNVKDDVKLTVWAKYKYRVGSKRFYPTFRFFLAGETKCALLSNNYLGDYDTEWFHAYSKDLIKYDSAGGVDLKTAQISNTDIIESGFRYNYNFCYLNAKSAENYDENEEDVDKWYQFRVKVPPFPESGQLAVYIYGLSASKGRTWTFPFLVRDTGNTLKQFRSPFDNWEDEGGDYPRLKIASINLGYIPTEDEEIPSEDYIYANENINFTDQRDPIEIFNGDTEDIVVQSSLIVPENTSGGKNKWDTSYNDFGLSDLGLILCKSIMSQYNSPYRLLDGSIKSNNIGYGTRYEFEAIPDIQWILLRGTFNQLRGYLEDATFAQITSNTIKKGGIINGEGLDPVWSFTGNIRCIQDAGENTGYYEEEEQDINSNSETFGDFRWVTKDIDTDLCPIGEPSKYYWGTDEAAYTLSNFKDYTIVEDEGGVVKVNYTQDGGEYIYFLHLASLGDVNRVANDFQFNIIDSFQYLSDVTINGYLYRVLRQDFVTSAMNNFTQTFDFN